MQQNTKIKTKIFPPVIEKIEDWPIHLQHQDREKLVEEISEFVLENFLARYSLEDLQDLIARTIYLEKIRIKEEPWKVDPPDERSFWRKISKQLLEESLHPQNNDPASDATKSILGRIVSRYAEEIVGDFKISTFLFARKFLTAFFKRLLNAAAGRNFLPFGWGTKKELYEKLRVFGPLEKIRELSKKGVLVVVPTHSSNLDSILVGYAMDAILGLPSFSYGAGLNLFNNWITAYFMSRLGAYRLDRRKKNPIYLETLKGMSKLSMERGTNSLFFPGGTRSRSGAIESKLKMGLLGTTVEAQRSLFEKEDDRRIILVPLVVSYHFALEAKFLIENYLSRTGKERYIRLRDQSFSVRKVARFFWQFFSATSDITLSFGQPMDVLGNFVDENGRSMDGSGKPVTLEEYFMTGGKVTADRQRESEYTKLLAERIVDRFDKENIVLTSHLVAFVAFQLLKAQNSKLDLFGLLRLPVEDFSQDYESFREVASEYIKVLAEMEKEGLLKLSKEMRGTQEEVVTDGIRKLGTYHARNPLKLTKDGQVISEDFKLLYYYHNRLDNFGLEERVRTRKKSKDFSLVP